MEAEVNASWGWGSAEVSGGGGGQYQSGREEFARALNDSVQEHTQEASSKRDTAVTSSTETSTTTGEELATERVIRNVNMRHVLNFVFRELNQIYITKIHLKDVRVAFTNGGLNSWREVPLSSLRRLLEEVLVPGKVDEVAQKILKLVAVVFDASDQPVLALETFTMTPDGLNWNRADAALGQNGQFPPPRSDFFYRFKRGALAQGNASNPVEGVLMKQTEVVLRTDSLVVEALLGQADALDEYAMLAQKADAEAREIANQRAKSVNEALAAIADGKERAAVYADIVRTNGQLKVELAQNP